MSYCQSNVELLRLGMPKLRTLLMECTDSSGQNISINPLHHLTISGVAFKGIYLKYFLPYDTLMIVTKTTTW